MILPFITWFSSRIVIGGDWRFFWQKNTEDFLVYTQAWDASLNGGLGKSNLEILWLNTYLGFGGHILTNILHIPWNISEKILFFWPIIFFSILGPYVISGLFTKRRLFRFISSFIYLTNTYALMIASGGQVGILLSYAVAPLSLYYFIRLFRALYASAEAQKPVRIIHTAIQFGLVSSFQMLFEPRMFIITVASFIIFAGIHSIAYPFNKKSAGRFFQMLYANLEVSIVIVLLLHAFWILPVFVSLPTESSFTSLSTIASADYFSFTRFENAFTLLHPNWPENVFGKTYFMRFQFLIIPLIGFGSLWFLKRSTQKRDSFLPVTVLFSGMLIIIGSFLAKGTNDPFGAVYQYATTHVPGFMAFRDASKFFLLVSVGYSLLLPASLLLITQKDFMKRLKHAPLYVATIFGGIWIFLHVPALTGEIGGTFKPATAPSEYAELYADITGDSRFYRTLWVPQISRFTPGTNQHPAVSITSLVSPYDTEALQSFFSDLKTEKYLQDLGIGYVILPSDPYGELFLSDRTFSEDVLSQTKSILDRTSYLSPVKTVNNLSVYLVKDPSERMTISVNGMTQDTLYKSISPSEYSVDLTEQASDYVLLFAETYDPNWKLIDSSGSATNSVKTKVGTNSFTISKEMSGTYRIYYSLQDWVHRGQIISVTTMAGLVVYWLLRLRRKYIYDRS
ncbi:MAG: hypothetical protein NUV98_07090 [Candidatus Roizmanbacteria bacterium]|nr:hypothetical protein [Candidatus Roizmanbacteria bacterium]